MSIIVCVACSRDKKDGKKVFLYVLNVGIVVVMRELYPFHYRGHGGGRRHSHRAAIDDFT